MTILVKNREKFILQNGKNMMSLLLLKILQNNNFNQNPFKINFGQKSTKVHYTQNGTAN